MTVRRVDKAAMFVFDPNRKRRRVLIVGARGMEMRIGIKDAHRLMQTLLLLDPRWEMLPADWRKYLIPKYQDIKGCHLADHKVPKTQDAASSACEQREAIEESILAMTSPGIAYMLGDIASMVIGDYGTLTYRTVSRHLARLVTQGVFTRTGDPRHYKYERVRMPRR